MSYKYICLQINCTKIFTSAVALEAHYATGHCFSNSYQNVGATTFELEGDIHPAVSTTAPSTTSISYLNSWNSVSFDQVSNNTQPNPADNEPFLSTELDTNAFSINNPTSAALLNYGGCAIDQTQAGYMKASNDDTELDSASAIPRSDSCSLTPRASDTLATIGNSHHPFSVGGLGRDCECVACVFERQAEDSKTKLVGYYSPYKYNCCFQPCLSHTFYEKVEWKRHYGTHLKQEGRFPCNSGNCKNSKRSFTRFVDLLRHSTNIHCLNPKKFPCDVLGCKYGGDNGFLRKDKLKDHKKNVHERKPVFGTPRPLRAIKPKTKA